MDSAEVKQRVERFWGNEERANVVMNDPEQQGYYQTNTDPIKRVETYPHFMNRAEATLSALVSGMQADNETAGVVRGSAAPGKVSVDADGTMRGNVGLPAVPNLETGLPDPATGVPGALFADGKSIVQSAEGMISAIIPEFPEIPNPLPVANRGTGATTAAQARTNLGISVPGSGFAPRPQAAAGVGQWVRLQNKSAGSVTLPSGGTWVYLACGSQGGLTSWAYAITGIAAGGNTLSIYSDYNNAGGFAWRIA